MRKLRVWCSDAGCDRCSKGVLVGKTLFGKNLYFCSAYEGKHQKVNGKDCGAGGEERGFQEEFLHLRVQNKQFNGRNFPLRMRYVH